MQALTADEAPEQQSQFQPGAGLLGDDIVASLPPDAPCDVLPPGIGPLEDQKGQIALAEEERTPEERYRLYLRLARQQMNDLLSWTGWLMEQTPAFRAAMWAQLGSRDVVEALDLTIERLRWVRENLAV